MVIVTPMAKPTKPLTTGKGVEMVQPARRVGPMTIQAKIRINGELFESRRPRNDTDIEFINDAIKKELKNG